MTTSIEIDDSMVEKIRNDLVINDYHDEIGNFGSMEELLQLIDGDDHLASLVFEVLINSAGYDKPIESFGEEGFRIFPSEDGT